jgi:hypothetical protein
MPHETVDRKLSASPPARVIAKRLFSRQESTNLRRNYEQRITEGAGLSAFGNGLRGVCHGQVRCADRFDHRWSRARRFRLRSTRAAVSSERANSIADTVTRITAWFSSLLMIRLPNPDGTRHRMRFAGPAIPQAIREVRWIR